MAHTLTTEAIEAIKALEDKSGRLTPNEVVAAAEDDASPLHEFFDWDDSEAARKWRIEQARELVRRVKLIIEVDGERDVRTVAYVRDPGRDDSEGGYVSLLRVRQDTAADVVRAELAACVGHIRRAESIARARANELRSGTADKIGVAAAALEAVHPERRGAK